MLTEDLRESAPLDRPITGLSIEGEYLPERHSRVLLDLSIHLDEGDAQFKRQFRSQGRLAGSAQPN